VARHQTPAIERAVIAVWCDQRHVVAIQIAVNVMPDSVDGMEFEAVGRIGRHARNDSSARLSGSDAILAHPEMRWLAVRAGGNSLRRTDNQNHASEYCSDF
jgi:hypothetical protein